jgi:hypothetical protein
MVELMNSWGLEGTFFLAGVMVASEGAS